MCLEECILQARNYNQFRAAKAHQLEIAKLANGYQTGTLRINADSVHGHV
jgi:hypothetical protein